MNGLYFTKVLKAAVERFPLDVDGIHGVHHWVMVYHNGTRIAERTHGADVEVVQHFGLLHDCCRVDDGTDIYHGDRAGDFIDTLEWLDLDEYQRQQLIAACRGHSDGSVSKDATIGACWDSDRLHLTRLNIFPQERYLSTNEGKAMAMGLNWMAA